MARSTAPDTQSAKAEAIKIFFNSECVARFCSHAGPSFVNRRRHDAVANSGSFKSVCAAAEVSVCVKKAIPTSGDPKRNAASVVPA